MYTTKTNILTRKVGGNIHMNLQAAFDNASEDLDAVNGWCTDVYNNTFAPYFIESRKLAVRLKSKDGPNDRPITDDELSWILIQLPINLFDVSEHINKLRISQEVIKLRIRDLELKSSKRQLYDVASDKLLVSAYGSVITRVENEISFSRELIMGAKKIWDARRRTDQANPINEIEDTMTTLPAYTSTVDSTKFRR